MIITCPACTARYQLQAHLADRRPVQCPRCQNLIPTTRQALGPPKGTEGGSDPFDQTVRADSIRWALPQGIRVVLTVVEGPDKGAKFPLTKARTTLGRRGADIRLNDPEVSKLHAAIIVSERGCFLQDLKSTNGSYLNGKQVAEAPLAGLDEIRLGGTRLLFSIGKGEGEEGERERDGTREDARKRVLVIEGSPLRQVLANLFAKANLEVIVARSGKEAKELFERGGPEADLLVLDLQMERADGFDVLASLKDEGLKRRPPILALTQVCALREILHSLDGLEVAALQPKGSPPEQIAACATGLLKPDGREQWVALTQARIDVLYQIGGETFRGIIANLSRTGLTIQAPHSCQLGTEVQLLFVLPEIPRLFRTKGGVRNVREAREAAYLDIEFLDLDTQGRSQIAAFVLVALLKRPVR